MKAARRPRCIDCRKPIGHPGACPECKLDRQFMYRVRLEQLAARKQLKCEAVIRERVEKYARIVELGIALFE